MSPRSAQPGTVYLVGAGPGDPDLLTRRAYDLLRTATLVLADGLVSAEVLALAGPEAEVRSVAKRCGQARISQAEIGALMVAGARAGQAVARRKSGDPLVFGRAGEEMAALRRAGVPFEVVPGISAAFAAAASLRVPLTDRGSASKLVLATAHHAAERETAQVWEGPLPADATLAVYMPGARLRALCDRLLRSGMAADTPVAAVSRVSTGDERVRLASVGTLQDEEVGLAPVILLIGDAVRSDNALAPGDDFDPGKFDPALPPVDL